MQSTHRPRDVSRSTIWVLFAVILVAPRAASIRAQEASVRAVPTFECLGLYLDVATNQGECQVRYRKAGTPDWRVGLPLVYDARNQQYRGSLVGLSPDTEYELRLEYEGHHIESTGRTRSGQIPIGKTTQLPGGETDQPLRITTPGRPDAWHLVTPTPRSKSVVDVFNLHATCVEVAADYVVVRGLQLKNAGRHAVLIRQGVQHVVIEDCHMTGWGRIGGARVWGITHGSDSAIYAESGAGDLIIQRNFATQRRTRRLLRPRTPQRRVAQQHLPRPWPHLSHGARRGPAKRFQT